MNIIEALRDPHLLGPFLGDDLQSWESWLTALRCVYGLRLSESERELVKQCTGRTKLPKAGFKVSLFLTGRRSGKSRVSALIAAFEAVLAGHESKLSKGEQGVVCVVSPTKQQSRIVFGYLRSIFSTPLLEQEIVKETRGHDAAFELRNNIRIETLAGDFRTIRGYTLVCAVLDELAFFGVDEEGKIRSDGELVRAVRPGLVTVAGKLIGITTPYARKGFCWQQYQRNFGNDAGKALVWNCPSRTMNPVLPESVIADAMLEDPQAARAEYLGEFRDDISAFILRAVIEACVVKGRRELPPQKNHRYVAFCDMSSGLREGDDDSALAVAHKEGEKVLIDLIRRYRPPFSPDSIVGEMVQHLRRYSIDRCVGDWYSPGFVKESFERRGIRYERASSNTWSRNPAKKSPKPKGQLYLELLPRLTGAQVELLDDEILIGQLAGLERRTRSGGRDVIDHGPNQHDDCANATAGAVDQAMQRRAVARIGFVGSLSAAEESDSGPSRLAQEAAAWLQHLQEIYSEPWTAQDEHKLRERTVLREAYHSGFFR